MPRDRRESDGTSERAESTPEERRREEQASTERWFANATVRMALTIVGFVLLLFALGQAFGIPLLASVADAITTQTGAWLVIAFFALLLIVGAQRGVPDY